MDKRSRQGVMADQAIQTGLHFFALDLLIVGGLYSHLKIHRRLGIGFGERINGSLWRKFSNQF